LEVEIVTLRKELQKKDMQQTTLGYWIISLTIKGLTMADMEWDTIGRG
jgi:hypothetical protein